MVGLTLLLVVATSGLAPAQVLPDARTVANVKARMEMLEQLAGAVERRLSEIEQEYRRLRLTAQEYDVGPYVLRRRQRLPVWLLGPGDDYLFDRSVVRATVDSVAREFTQFIEGKKPTSMRDPRGQIPDWTWLMYDYIYVSAAWIADGLYFREMSLFRAQSHLLVKQPYGARVAVEFNPEELVEAQELEHGSREWRDSVRREVCETLSPKVVAIYTSYSDKAVQLFESYQERKHKALDWLYSFYPQAVADSLYAPAGFEGFFAATIAGSLSMLSHYELELLSGWRLQRDEELVLLGGFNSASCRDIELAPVTVTVPRWSPPKRR